MAGLDAAALALIPAIGTAGFLAPVGAAQTKTAGFDIGAQFFQMIQNFGRGLAGEQDGEFFSAATVSFSSSRNARQARRNHAQNLVSNVVAVRIVAALEMIDVEHC